MIKNTIQSIKDSVRLYKNKTALINGETRLTYAEIDAMSDCICKYLLDNSIGKEQVVAVYMDRSYYSVISVLGILKSGAAFLPIDIETPLYRVNTMVTLSGAKHVLMDEMSIKNANALAVSGANVCDMLQDNVETDDCSEYESVSGNTLAYILFTSGSTGIPKGAMIEYAGMNNHLFEKIRVLNLTNDSVVAHNASISFDVSVWQMLSPLCVGATVVIYPEKSIMNLRNFLSITHDNGVQVLEVVPTYLSLLINECKNDSHYFAGLRYIVSTGEVLTKNLADRCFEVLPDVLLVNAYGPTEASDDITHCVFDRNHSFEHVPIGKPISNAELSIVRPDGSLCEVNEPGELLVSGICVGRGYVGNDEETKLSFSQNSTTGAKTYRTGDLVSLKDDGNYYFHDRMDMQIAFHGKRVEIKEIENTMLKYAGVDAVAVVYNPKNQQLYAFYISDMDIDDNNLKAYLKDFLPAHMIPAFMTRIDKIPVTLNGKADYNALVETIGSSGANPVLEANNDNDLLQIIMDVVGIDELPQGDHWKTDIRSVGFNSINAIKLVILLEDIYDIEIEDDKLVPGIIYNYNELKKLVGLS